MRVTLLLLLWLPVIGRAQHTVTRAVMQTIPCSSATTFVVYAEKATIAVTGWNNNYIQVKIDFFATHPDKAVAQRELDYMKYAIAKEKNTVELRNMFALPAAVDQLQSKLVIKMELMVPATNKLQVTNKYGDINLTQLSGNIQLSVAFGDVYVTDIAGNLNIAASYGDIRGTGIKSTAFYCKDEMSTIALDLHDGQYSFNSKHSNIDLTLHHIQALHMVSNRSDITIRPQSFATCRYKIVNTGGRLFLPGKYAGSLVKKGNQTSFITTGSAAWPLLSVTANYNSVTIK